MRRPAALANARDLGGVPVFGGRVVRSGVLLRSDAPYHDDAASPPLPAWPPRTVIDLRSPGEVDDGHPLDGTGATVHAVSLSRQMSVGDMAGHDELLANGLAGLYRVTLRSSGASVAQVVGLIAAGDDPVLVHCAAGKDRTGLVIAAVLGAIGAPREAIVADYVATDGNMDGVIARMTAEQRPAAATLRRLIDEHPEGLRAPAAAIEAALDVFDAAGGAAAWLRSQGLPEAALTRLRQRLIDDQSRTPA